MNSDTLEPMTEELTEKRNVLKILKEKIPKGLRKRNV